MKYDLNGQIKEKNYDNSTGWPKEWFLYYLIMDVYYYNWLIHLKFNGNKKKTSC